jgi:hypothetical protein
LHRPCGVLDHEDVAFSRPRLVHVFIPAHGSPSFRKDTT